MSKSNFKFSIIIPCYNSEKTLNQSLTSICNIPKKYEYEIIIVDDGSTDRSTEIISKYPVRLFKQPVNGGAGHARNRGVNESKYNIILFLDTDVIVEPNILDKIVENFNTKQADCVVGVFAKENPYPDFFSQYKSLYCNYKYLCIKGSAAVNTAITAVKKEVFHSLGGFNTTISASEDNEFAKRLYLKGYTIGLDITLEVINLKEFNLKSLMINDYKKSIALSQIFFRSIKSRDLRVDKELLEKKEFTDITIYSMLNVPIVYLISLLIIFNFVYTTKFSLLILSVLLIWYLTNNLRFWKYINYNKNVCFTIKSIIITFIDYIFVGFGILKGLQTVVQNKD